jgi:hypothetical protein
LFVLNQWILYTLKIFQQAAMLLLPLLVIQDIIKKILLLGISQALKEEFSDLHSLELIMMKNQVMMKNLKFQILEKQLVESTVLMKN